MAWRRPRCGKEPGWCSWSAVAPPLRGPSSIRPRPESRVRPAVPAARLRTARKQRCGCRSCTGLVALHRTLLIGKMLRHALLVRQRPTLARAVVPLRLGHKLLERDAREVDLDLSRGRLVRECVAAHRAAPALRAIGLDRCRRARAGRGPPARIVDVLRYIIVGLLEQKTLGFARNDNGAWHSLGGGGGQREEDQVGVLKVWMDTGTKSVMVLSASSAKYSRSVGSGNAQHRHCLPSVAK